MCICCSVPAVPQVVCMSANHCTIADESTCGKWLHTEWKESEAYTKPVCCDSQNRWLVEHLHATVFICNPVWKREYKLIPACFYTYLFLYDH